LKMMMVALKLAGIPLLRPLHKLAAELLEVIYGDEASLSKHLKP
jgi:hypothetical protein